MAGCILSLGMPQPELAHVIGSPNIKLSVLGEGKVVVEAA
jgi:hypothetical protein